ncbi:MAG: hypothetical protein H7840_11240 [Alphaproteobacteria bacterium]
MLNILSGEVQSCVLGLWRRRWRAAWMAWGLCLGGWLVVAAVPDQYRSSARVYVDTESTLGPLLKNIAVDADPRRQVDVMQRTLMSRPNLAQVARLTDLDLTAGTPIALERLYVRMAEHIAIVGDGLNTNLYTVSYTAPDPVLARNVVQSLLTIFVEGNVGKSRENMENALTFIERQISDYERQLKQADQRLADFKARHFAMYGEAAAVGSGSGTFAVRLETARTALMTAKRAHEDGLTRRDQLRAQLQVVPQFLEVDHGGPAVMAGPQGAPLAVRVEELRRDLDTQRMRFTEEHPDVIATRAALAQAQDQLRREGPGGAFGSPTRSRSRISNVVYEQLKVRLVDAETEVATLARRETETTREFERMSRLAASAPAVDAEFADLNRDYGVLRKQYEELLSRRESARISQAVDSTGDKVQFRIVEPPNLPVVPDGPPRRLFLAVVLVAALGGSAGFAILLSRVEEAVDDAGRLTRLFNLPVLGTVSAIESASDRRRRATDILGLGVVTGLMVITTGVLVVAADSLPKVSALVPWNDLQPLLERMM